MLSTEAEQLSESLFLNNVATRADPEESGGPRPGPKHAHSTQVIARSLQQIPGWSSTGTDAHKVSSKIIQQRGGRVSSAGRRHQQHLVTHDAQRTSCP